MAPDRFKRLADLFSAAVQQGIGEPAEVAKGDGAGDERLEAEVKTVLPARVDETATTETMDFNQYGGRLFKSRYHLDRVLGRGGFAVVYLGHDPQLHDRLVVVNILVEHVDRAWFLRKFEGEWKALARIRHPGVVGVLDHGETPERTPFIVMEFVEGSTLQSAIIEEGMELARV